MYLKSILSVVILLTAQGAYSRYASLNIGLNISAHISDDNNNQLSEQLVRICMQETQISMADLYKFKTNNIQEAEVNESIQCFANCIYEQLGVMRNGLFAEIGDSQKRPANAIDSVAADKNFSVCKSIRGQNKCETAYKVHKCVQKIKFGLIRDQAFSVTTEQPTDDNDEDDSDSSSGPIGQ